MAREKIPGPGMLEGMRRLYPSPFPKLPAFIADVTRRYGDIVAFTLPGRRFVLLNHPDQIKDLLVTQQQAFVKSEGARALRLLLGDGLLTSEEPHHRQMRRIVQPAFHHERIARYARTMVESACEWTDQRAGGDRFDLHAAMSALTLRIASLTLFGVDASEDASDVRSALHTVLEAYPSTVTPLALLKQSLGLSRVTRAFNDARARLDRVIYALIARRRAQPGDRNDALSMLLEASDPETGYRLSDEQVRDEAMTLFLAGHETTANALTWTWYLLARHPEIEARVHAEVDALASFEDPFSALVALPYTRLVLRESMRLYPPAWIIGRESTCPVTLAGGYALKSGTTVFVCALALHRREELYPDPLRFHPDRWIASEVPPFAYLPFGGGARRCIGEEFAWAEGTLVLAALAKRFRFVLETDRELELQPLVTLRPKGPVPIRLVERSVQQA
ncbi:MAG TPA: cytochrome P450 [Candidatus Baltobacteraceae bacterium]|nr:cytochrome P450 [Candidatus Baltobacteraceae bacterium]